LEEIKNGGIHIAVFIETKIRFLLYYL